MPLDYHPEDGSILIPLGHGETVGECSRCGSWPIEADEKNEGLSACCGSYLITD